MFFYSTSLYEIRVAAIAGYWSSTHRGIADLAVAEHVLQGVGG
jgi:hypothetical protein